MTVPNAAVLTITDNDNAPTISISDISQNEGDSGISNFIFNVQLSTASAFAVAVNYANLDGTASSPIDYLPTSGTINFLAGETFKTVSVTINGDTESEANESFYIQLTNPTNATIADNQDFALILEDDGAQGFEADVASRFAGDGVLTVTDFTQVGRFVAGLDTNYQNNEFQRTDSAPRNLLGNGVLDVADFTQAGRYAAGLDVATPAGGAVAPNLFEFSKNSKLTDESLDLFNDLSGLKKASKDGTQNLVPTIVRVVNVDASAGQQVFVTIETDVQGTENGFGFTLNYDSTKLSAPLVTKGADTQNATLIPNIAQVGKIGVVLAMPFGEAILTGTRHLVTVRFNVAANASGGSTPLTFGDMPVIRAVSEVDANTLQSTFQDGAINILGPTSASVTVGGKITDASGNGISKAQISITAANGETRTTLTSSFGFYRFDDIQVGESYVVTVRHKTHQFSPQIIAVFEAMENVDFTAVE